MCEQCKEANEGQHNAGTTVKFYQSFLEQGIQILEHVRDMPDKDKDFLARKINIFQMELENLYDLTIIGSGIYDNAGSIPQQFIDENPEAYKDTVRQEELRHSVNTFLDEV